MGRLKKFSLSSNLPEITTDIEIGEVKTITYQGHKYSYRIDKYSMYKDYYIVSVSGGQHKGSITTTCAKASIKKKLKRMIISLTHK